MNAPAPMGAAGYVPKTAPYNHQKIAFELSERKQAFALTMEMRTGKSKVFIDTAAAAYERWSINAALVVAPKGVDKNWANDEIPAHLPDRIPRMILVYRASDASTKRFKEAFAALLAFPGMAWLCMNVQATRTDAGKKWAEKFLRGRKVIFGLDESSDIKTPKSQQCRSVTRLGKMAKARRIMDGAPNAENPLEIFSQYRFLDSSIIGFTSNTAFKSRYAVYEAAYRFDPKTGANKEYPKLKEYAHLDELKAKIAPFTYRVRADDVLDMPKHVYQKVHYELEGEQKRVYEALRDEYAAELQSGERIEVRNLLTRYLRLQQVLGNRIPSSGMRLCPACDGEGCLKCDDEGVISDKGSRPGIIDTQKNPRIVALTEALQTEVPRPTILWARFRGEVDDLLTLGRQLGRKVCRYDGATSDDDRETNKRGFQNGEFDWFVGSAAAGGRGLTLSAAQLVVYYSNYFSLRLRLQSEVRGDAPGKKFIGVLDMMADDTIDEILISSMRSKQTLSAMMMNDPQKVWI